MNIKYLLPIAFIAAMTACSSDDSSSTVTSANPSGDTTATQVPTDPAATDSAQNSTDPAATDPATQNPTDSTATDPVNPPAASSANLAPGDYCKIDPAAPSAVAFDATKSYKFYGCELTGRDSYKYGRFEARIKMAATSGTVSSMFLYYDNSYLGEGEKWNEVDIEILGNKPTGMQTNIISGTLEKKVTSEDKPDLGFDATECFHLYGMIWTPDYVAWEIDSVEVRRDSIGLTKAQVEDLTESQSLRFNLWASKTPSWTGAFTGEGLPVEEHIDYVRVYSYDEASKGFNLLWQDDFEGEDLDLNRWAKGNWDMENVKYRTKNIRVENGFAKIRLDFDEVAE